MFATRIVVFDPATDVELPLSMEHGPRAIARGLKHVFNDDPKWEPRSIGACALILADFTAEETTLERVRSVLAPACLDAYIP